MWPMNNLQRTLNKETIKQNTCKSKNNTSAEAINYLWMTTNENVPSKLSLNDLLRFSGKTGRKTCLNEHGLWLK